jgi:hypothetical protein
MIPVAIGVGALLGGLITIIFSEADKKELREQIVRQDDTISRLQQDVRRASDREVQQRKEILRLTLEWSKGRLETLMQAPSTPLGQLERVWSVGQVLDGLCRSLPADGVLPPADKAFVDAIAKVRQGAQLTQVERALIEDHLEAVLGNQRRRFLEDRLTQQYKSVVKQRAARNAERDKASLQLAAHELVERTSKKRHPEQPILASRIARCGEEIEAFTRRIEQLEFALITLSRAESNAGSQQDDEIARELALRLAGGRELTGEEARFLEYYRDRYFAQACEELKVRRGIHLALQAEAV